MPPHFLDLSDDILLEIYGRISVTDVLTLKQTCRVLHAFGCNDYLWRQIILKHTDLPLHISPYVDPASLPAADLQRVIIGALRLEHNWQKPVSDIKTLTRALHGDIVFDMHLLPGAQWLVTLSKGASTTRMSLWSLQDLRNIYRAALFDIPGAGRCAAALQRNGSQVVIAVIISVYSRETLNIYNISLTGFNDIDNFAGPNNPSPVSISRTKSQGLFYEVHACEHIVAATLANFTDDISLPSYQIIFVNTITGVQTIVAPQLPQNVSRLTFKLYSHYIIIKAIILHSTVVIRVYGLPPPMLATAEISSPVRNGIAIGYDLGQPLAEFTTLTTSSPHDYQVSESAYFKNTSRSIGLSILSFPSFHASRPGTAYLHRLLLDGSLRRQSNPPAEIMYTDSFVTPSSTSVASVSLGSTGRRAVWLEDGWETDEFRLMKMSSPEPGKRPVVGPLLAPHSALPFSTRACQSIAFDESCGRVCLALHTGELYILDFS